MVIQLYFNEVSPPSRNVKSVLKLLCLDFEIKHIELQKQEHKTPEYLALNPIGKIPCIVDGDYIIHESRAIATYLCNQYEKKSKESSLLYPIEPKARGAVDKLLYVSEVISEAIMSYLNIRGILFRKEKVKSEKYDEVAKAYNVCEMYLSKTVWIAADHFTLADIFMSSCFHILDSTVGYDGMNNCPKTADWLSRIRALPYFIEINQPSLNRLHLAYVDAVEKNTSM